MPAPRGWFTCLCDRRTGDITVFWLKCRAVIQDRGAALARILGFWSLGEYGRVIDEILVRAETGSNTRPTAGVSGRAFPAYAQFDRVHRLVSRYPGIGLDAVLI